MTLFIGQLSIPLRNDIVLRIQANLNRHAGGSVAAIKPFLGDRKFRTGGIAFNHGPVIKLGIDIARLGVDTANRMV